jgi:hypothetical protein
MSEDQHVSLKFWTDKMGFEVKSNHPMGPNTSWIELGPPDLIIVKNMIRHFKETSDNKARGM